MILLFSGMQSSLSMVYDREMGSMRVLLTSPMPRWYLLSCKLSPACWSRCCRSMCSCSSPGSMGSSRAAGYLAVLPALILAGLMLGAFGLLLSSVIRHWRISPG